MARKKTEPVKMPATAEPETKTKPVRLDLSPEVHQMLRVVSAEQGKPMAIFAREVVESTVREMYQNLRG
jgi:predicted DNA-binding protein